MAEGVDVYTTGRSSSMALGVSPYSEEGDRGQADQQSLALEQQQAELRAYAEQVQAALEQEEFAVENQIAGLQKQVAVARLANTRGQLAAQGGNPYMKYAEGGQIPRYAAGDIVNESAGTARG